MSIEDCIKSYFASINHEDFDLLFDLFAEDATLHCPVNYVAEGVDKIKPFYLKVPENYPEHVDTPVDWILDGNKAAVFIRFEGRNAAGVGVAFNAVDWFVFESGRIKSLDVFFDSLGVSRLLGKGSR